MGFISSALLADPFLSVAEHYNPDLWELSFHDKVRPQLAIHGWPENQTSMAKSRVWSRGMIPSCHEGGPGSSPGSRSEHLVFLPFCPPPNQIALSSALSAALNVTAAMQLEGAKLVHEHELRLRMDAAIGRAPPLEDGELQVSTSVLLLMLYLRSPLHLPHSDHHLLAVCRWRWCGRHTTSWASSRSTRSTRCSTCCPTVWLAPPSL